MFPSSAIVVTAIYPPAYSLADLAATSARVWARALPLVLLLILVAITPSGSLTAATSVRLDLASVDHPSFSLHRVSIAIGAEGSTARIALGRVRFGERVWSDLELECSQFVLAEGRIRCDSGRLRLPGVIEPVTIALSFDPDKKSGWLRLRSDQDESVDVSLRADGGVVLTLGQISLARSAAWLPWLAELGPGGRFDGRMDLAPGAGALRVTGQIRDGRFSDPTGLKAAEELGLELDIGARLTGGAWRFDGTLSWVAGAAYLHPLYLESGASLSAVGVFSPKHLILERASLSLDGFRSLEANGVFDLDPLHIERLALSLADADLAVVGPRFLTPLIAPERVSAVRFGGRMSAGLQIVDGSIVAIDAALDHASLALDDPDVGLGPVTGVLPWRSDTETRVSLDVGGGHWKKLILNGFMLEANVEDRSVSIESLSIPVLDGRLVVTDLAMQRNETGWAGGGGVVVEPISMELLTTAVGLPQMSGRLSAALPGLRISPGEVSLDGALAISVFDGYLWVTRLQLLEAFGVAAHVFAEVEARNLDLGMLTKTFAFGSVTGFIDADIHGLELVRWKPVRFDASVRSSPGRYPKRISQRAVQNIGALGGAGAVAVLQRGFLGFFDSFGYSEIGLSCRLEVGVCRMSGLDTGDKSDPASGFRIIRGGGIPALNVIGYNRLVDWDELLDRLQRVIESNASPVIE